MRIQPILLLSVVLAACGGEKAPVPDSAAVPQFPTRRLATTIGDSASTIEGIVAVDGALYTADWKDGAIYRVDTTGAAAKVGQLPTTPGQWILGITADSAGNLFFAVPETGTIWRVGAERLGAADFDPATDATAYATGALGANGIGFDRNGHLFISGGDRNALYHVAPGGGAAQVLAQGYATINPDTTMPVRAFVTNGIAFDAQGNAYTANTGTGVITKLEVKPDYTVGAIGTYAEDVRLTGADGLLMDADGTLYVTANFRNAFLAIAPGGAITELAVSAPGEGVTVDSAGRELGPANVLRFPAEFARIGKTFYTANLNFPVGANGAQTAKGATIGAVTLP